MAGSAFFVPVSGRVSADDPVGSSGMFSLAYANDKYEFINV